MYVAIWLALGLLATAFTFAWVLGNERIYIKAALSVASWSILAITTGGLYTLTDTGEEIAVDAPSLYYFSAGLAVLSFAIMVLYRFDEYPPPRDGAQSRQ